MSDTAAAVPAIENAGAADQPSSKRRKGSSHTEVKGGERKVAEASARVITTAPPLPQHEVAHAVITTHEESWLWIDASSCSLFAASRRGRRATVTVTRGGAGALAGVRGYREGTPSARASPS